MTASLQSSRTTLLTLMHSLLALKKRAKSTHIALTRVSSQSTGFDPDLSVAVALVRMPEGHLHTGLIYRAHDGHMRIAHLAFHLLLADCSLPTVDDYCIFPLNLEAYHQGFLASEIEQLVEDHPHGIPYSVEHEGRMTFTDQLKWTAKEPGQGLTCSTFVSEVLRLRGYDMLQITTWRERPGDSDFKKKLLEWLSNYIQHAGLNKDHVAVQVQRLGSTVRVRPEDVAVGARLYKGQGPLPFDLVEPPASDVANRI